MDVIVAADFCQVLEVLDVAMSILKRQIDADNVICCLTFAKQFCLHELENWCWKYTKYHFKSVSSTKSFFDLDINDLRKLLASGKAKMTAWNSVK
jgi:hypothetical protein